jgi:hypothetical protein
MCPLSLPEGSAWMELAMPALLIWLAATTRPITSHRPMAADTPTFSKFALIELHSNQMLQTLSE